PRDGDDGPLRSRLLTRKGAPAAQVSGRRGFFTGAVTFRPARRTSPSMTIPTAPGRPSFPDGRQRGASFSGGRSLGGHEPHTDTQSRFTASPRVSRRSRACPGVRAGSEVVG